MRCTREQFLRIVYEHSVPVTIPSQAAARSGAFLSHMDDIAERYDVTTRTFSWVPKVILLTLAAALLLTVALVILL